MKYAGYMEAMDLPGTEMVIKNLLVLTINMLRDI